MYRANPRTLASFTFESAVHLLERARGLFRVIEDGYVYISTTHVQRGVVH